LSPKGYTQYLLVALFVLTLLVIITSFFGPAGPLLFGIAALVGILLAINQVNRNWKT